jgi:2-polyprenyl-6-methoxyphenol hydroxylase-like FAD-dependent oxidoreductase
MPDMMNANRDILISGAGIRGLTLAFWLQHFGFQPTIVEKRRDLCDQGYMIDFYGSGFDVAERMGLLDQLRARHYPIPDMKVVDSRGSVRASLSIEKFRQLLDFRHFNFMCGDLEDVLYQNLKERVPVQFNTSIAEIQQQTNKVAVQFSNGSCESFDLVLGADGIHSNTRHLLWGSESQFDHYLGFNIACGVIDNFLSRPAVYTFLTPQHHVTVYPIREGQLATFFAWTSNALDATDRDRQLQLLDEALQQSGWIVPQLLEAPPQSHDLYFDAVAQIQLNPWHKGRVALVGDACQCLTLLAGRGASIAMAGAYILAMELQRRNGNYQVAFQNYQDQLQPEIARRQTEAQRVAKSFVPDSERSIWLLYLFLKLAFLPGFRVVFRREIGARSLIH